MCLFYLFCVMHNYLLTFALSVLMFNLEASTSFAFRSAALVIRPVCPVFATCALIFWNARSRVTRVLVQVVGWGER